MTLVCWSWICCTIAGCEKITTEEITPTTMKINAGASQLDMVGLEFLTSSKTSPGAAKTFSSRDHKVVGAGWDTESGLAGVVSMQGLFCGHDQNESGWRFCPAPIRFNHR